MIRFVFAALLALTAAAQAADPQLVILDNDFLGPGGSDIQSAIPLLADPDVKLLGFTVVTGDQWRDEEVLHLRRFLEISGHDNVPVFPGSAMPLKRTQAEMKNWETHYGMLIWKGAWMASKPNRSYHPDQPGLIPPLKEGAPAPKPNQDAIAFLIRSVHEHPHQITIIAAGPLTNIALAVRRDPEFALLAKQLVFMGGFIDTNLGQVTGNPDYNTDFNFIFDPEAAQIVLHAPFAKITSVGSVTNDTVVAGSFRDQLKALHTPTGDYLAKFSRVGQPFWDEIAAEIALDPSLVTSEVVARLDVDVLRGPDYGRAHVWRDDLAPHQGEQLVHLVEKIDVPRFMAALGRDVARVQNRRP